MFTINSVGIFGFEPLHGEVDLLQEGAGTDIACEDVTEPVQPIGFETSHQVCQLVALHDGAGPASIARVVAELHRIDRMHLKAQHLQGEDGALVANVTRNYMTLDRQHLSFLTASYHPDT